MVDTNKVVCNLTEQIVELTASKKVLRSEIKDVLTENESLNHIIAGMQCQLQTAGEEIAGYKKVLSDNGFQV